MLDTFSFFVYIVHVMREEPIDVLEYNRIALEEELNKFMELLGDK